MARIPFLGYEAGWADITVTMLGRVVVGITKVAFTTGKMKENIYGWGDEPIARGGGNKTYKGTLGMLGSEVAALRDIVPSGNIHDIGMFTVTIVYNVGGVVKTTTLENVEFADDVEDTISQSDTHKKFELPLIIGRISYR